MKRLVQLVTVVLAALALAPAAAPASPVARFFDSCVVVPAGTVSCWQYTPASTGPDGIVTVPGVTGATDIAAGEQHHCAIVTGGTVSCWGFWRGFVPQTLVPPVPEPATTVAGISGATAIAAGARHTCAIVTGGSVRCWGGGDSGELGDGETHTSTDVPVTVKGVTGATAIAAGVSRTCVVAGAGGVWCWGEGGGSSATPKAVAGVPAAIGIAVGDDYACVLTVEHTVACWGEGGYGQLGDGRRKASATAVEVRGLRGVRALSASFSGSTCAIVARGAIACWGIAADSVLGHLRESAVPVRIPGIRGATALSTSCAVVPGVAVRCWGNDASRVPAGAKPWSTRTVVKLGDRVLPPPGPGAWIDGTQVDLVGVTVAPRGACPARVSLEVRTSGELRSLAAATTHAAGRCRVTAHLQLAQVPHRAVTVTMRAAGLRPRTLTLARP